MDIVFFTKNDSYYASKELFEFVVWDIMTSYGLDSFFQSTLYSTSYQDTMPIIIKNSPELVVALNDFIEAYFINSTFHRAASAIFDSIADSGYVSLDELIKYYLMFMMFSLISCFLLNESRIQSVFNSIQSTVVKFEIYLFSMSRDLRVSFEAILILFFLLFLYGTMMVLAFDDDQEEFLEYFEQLMFTGVFYAFIYYVIRVGVHFFSFLEASVSEGRTFSFVLSQFRRDALNGFAFIMRLCTLMLRFYIYETTDDILDSYYIFVGDFDDDEYMNETFFSLSSILFFDVDNNDDRSILLEDELDLSWDLFSIYFITLMKLDSFIF